MNQTLEDFLKNALTATQWDQLPEKMGWTKNKLTYMLKNPNNMSFEETVAMASLCACQPMYLVETFGCGKSKITLIEATEILNKQANEL